MTLDKSPFPSLASPTIKWDSSKDPSSGQLGNYKLGMQSTQQKQLNTGPVEPQTRSSIFPLGQPGLRSTADPVPCQSETQCVPRNLDSPSPRLSRRGPAPCRLAAWGPGSVRGGGHELGRISLQELTNARQVGQLVAFYVLGVHAVKQEGAIQVLYERGLWSEIQRAWRTQTHLIGPGEGLVGQAPPWSPGSLDAVWRVEEGMLPWGFSHQRQGRACWTRG